MTLADRYAELHLRLVLDTKPPFDATGKNTAQPTPAGRAWLRDLAHYHDLEHDLRLTGAEPAMILQERFGFVIGDGEPDAAPDHSMTR